MSDWNEIAGDHHAELSWSGELGCDADGYPLDPPSNNPSINGGIDAWIGRATQSRVSTYRCKFCRSLIGFMNRKPLNLVDGSPHRCLAESVRNAAAPMVKEQQ